MDPNNLVSTKQAAKMLDVSIRTVHRMASSGRLEVAYKVPVGNSGAMLFHRAHVIQLRTRLNLERSQPGFRRIGRPRKDEVRMP